MLWLSSKTSGRVRINVQVLGILQFMLILLKQSILNSILQVIQDQNPVLSFCLCILFFQYHLLHRLSFPWRHSCKEPASQCRRHRRGRFNSWVGKIPWRRKWEPAPVFLPVKPYGQRGLVDYSPKGRKEPDMTKHAGVHGRQ